MEKAKEFKDFVVEFFDGTRKTGWGKNEVTRQITGLWSEFLMREIRRKDEKVQVVGPSLEDLKRATRKEIGGDNKQLK